MKRTRKLINSKNKTIHYLQISRNKKYNSERNKKKSKSKNRLSRNFKEKLMKSMEF